MARGLQQSQGQPRPGRGAAAADGDQRTLRWFRRHILRMVMLLRQEHMVDIRRLRRTAIRHRMDILLQPMAIHRQGTLLRMVIRRLAIRRRQGMGPMGLHPMDILRRLGMGRDRRPPAPGCWAGKMAG